MKKLSINFAFIITLISNLFLIYVNICLGDDDLSYDFSLNKNCGIIKVNFANNSTPSEVDGESYSCDIQIFEGALHFPNQNKILNNLKKQKKLRHSIQADHKTPDAIATITFSQHLNQMNSKNIKKEAKKSLDELMLKKIRVEVFNILEIQYKAIKENLDLLENSNGISKKEVYDKIEEVRKLVFDNEGLSPEEEIKKYLYLYPEIKYKIINDDTQELSPMRPILCHYISQEI